MSEIFSGLPAGLRTAPAPSLSEVAEDIYAYVQPPGGWCMSNSGVVAGPRGALVIDTLATVGRAERLRDAVDSLRTGSGRTLVNTHHHGDHTFGNQVFGDSATIVGHELARKEMADTGLALTGLWPQVQWGEVELTPPALTFRERLTVHVGARRAELIHLGPAHTSNDVVVWLPEERVLFAGDVLFSGAAPFSLFGSVSGTLDAIRTLRSLSPRTVVSGHGPVTGPEVFEENVRYLEWIQQLAEQGSQLGLSPLETARSVGPEARQEFGHLLDGERIVGNLHRAYAELRGGPPGEPLDAVGIFAEMVEYNGGRLPTCLA